MESSSISPVGDQQNLNTDLIQYLLTEIKNKNTKIEELEKKLSFEVAKNSILENEIKTLRKENVEGVEICLKELKIEENKEETPMGKQ